MIVACDNCYLFHVQDSHTGLEIALVAMAALAIVGALVSVVLGSRHEGRHLVGSVLIALGLVLVPISAGPLVVMNDLTLTTEHHSPAGSYVTTTFVGCDKAIYAPWNYDREMPTADTRAALDACRQAAARSFGLAAVVFGVATAASISGVLMILSNRRSRGARSSGRPRPAPV